MDKSDYIIIESDETEKEIPPHTEDEAASVHTMHAHGVFIEKPRKESPETHATAASTHDFLAKSGIEIMIKKPGDESPFE